jgi:hypothetical protein
METNNTIIKMRKVFISMPSFSPPKADRLKPRALARMNLSAAEGGRGFSPKPPS